MRSETTQKRINPATLLYATTMISAGLLTLARPVETDLWWRIETGRLTAQSWLGSGSSDNLTPTAFPHAGWLLDLWLYGIHHFAGEPGFQLFRVLVVCWTVHLLVRPRLQADAVGSAEPCQPRLAVAWLPILALPAICLGQQFATDSLTVLYSVMCLRLLDWPGLSSATLLKLAALQLVWCNADPRFLLGPAVSLLWAVGVLAEPRSGHWSALTGAVAGGQHLRATRYFLATGLLLVTSLANPRWFHAFPSGLKSLLPGWFFPGELCQLMAPLGPTLQSTPAVVPRLIWFVLLLIAAMSLVRAWPRPSVSRCLVLASVGFLGAWTVRDASLAAAVAVLVATANVRNPPGEAADMMRAGRWIEVPGGKRLGFWAGAATATVAPALSMLVVSGWIEARSLGLGSSPAGASDLRNAGSVLASLGWHGHLFAADVEHVGQAIWYCGGNSDSVFSPCPDEWDLTALRTARLVQDVREGRYSDYVRPDGLVGGWRRAFDELGIDLLVMGTKRLSTYRRIRGNPYWRLLHRDDRVVVLGRANLPAFARTFKSSAEAMRELEWPMRETKALGSSKPRGRFWPGLLDPGRSEARIDGARSLVALGFPLAALRQAREILGEKSRDSGAANVLAEAQLALAAREQLESGQVSWLRHVLVLSSLRRVVELGGTPVRGIAETSAAMGLTGVSRSTEDVRVKAAEDQSNQSQGFAAPELDRARQLLEDGEITDAAALLRGGHWPSEVETEVRLLTGVVAMCEGRYEEAANGWRDAMQAGRRPADWPATAELSYWIALSYAELGNRSEAEHWLSRVVAATQQDQGGIRRNALALLENMAQSP